MSETALVSTFTPDRALVAECQQVLATHARSFSWGQVLLPAQGRDEAAILYAFCRLVDDLADESPSAAIARAELDLVERELLGERPARPVVAAAAEILRRGPGVQAARELITGALTDQDEVIVADDGELLRYCYRVAGTVGLMMCPVIGVTDPSDWPAALDLGIGMQLTNICRDVAEDARMGRVYLPTDRLAAVGVTPQQLLDGEADPAAVSAVVADLLGLADRYYESGLQGCRAIPWRSRGAILVAAHIYREIGHKLRRNGSDPLAGRTIVPWTSKLPLVPAALFDGLRRARSTAEPHDPTLHEHLADMPGTSST